MTGIRDDEILSELQRLVQRLNEMPDRREAQLTGIGALIADYLGTDPRDLPTLRELVDPHRLVDADVALDRISGEDAQARTLGVSGGQERQHEDFAALLGHRYALFAPGPIDYSAVATGPHTTRQVVTFGIRLFHLDGVAVAVLQRGPDNMSGRPTGILEIISANPATTDTLLERLHTLMAQLSVLRGNIVTFAPSEFGQGVGGMTFLERPRVDADQIVLPDGLLSRIVGHVVEISRHAPQLLERGQHLKRGVLLYGPPGTGKTLTMRHLLSLTPDTTAILLQGGTLEFVGEAARLARALAPSIVVLEDVDLVAMERGRFGGPQPLLFEVLDALDGIDGDADVAFVLTTNRADVLEPALAQRPGRIDLAAEIPLPDAEARRALFRIYATGLALKAAAVDAAADRAAGMTASFAKELMRRTVMLATLAERTVLDDDLETALTDMLASTQKLSAVLFGGAGEEIHLGADGSAGFAPRDAESPPDWRGL